MVYDEIVQRYGDSDELGLQIQVAAALNDKGLNLGALGRLDEAIATARKIPEKVATQTAPSSVSRISMILWPAIDFDIEAFVTWWCTSEVADASFWGDASKRSHNKKSCKHRVFFGKTIEPLGLFLTLPFK